MNGARITHMPPVDVPVIERRVRAVIAKLVIDEPFFGTLALRLRLVIDATCRTAWTDGERIGYSPAFVAGLSIAALVGLVVHELFHCAMGHPWRRGGRDPFRWNVACDYAVNYEIQRAGFTLPDGSLIDARWAGRSAEWIYDRLPVEDEGEEPEGGYPGAPPSDEDGDEDGEGGGGGGGDEDGDEDGEDGEDSEDGEGGGGGDEDGDEDEEPSEWETLQPGEVRDAPEHVRGEDGEDTARRAPTEQEWRQAVADAAAISTARGEMGDGLKRVVDTLLAPPLVDWREALAAFFDGASAERRTWARLDRRLAPQDIFQQSWEPYGMGAVVIVADTSMSIDDVTLAQIESEARGLIATCEPERTTVIYADDSVNAVQTFERGEPIELESHGGGCTDFRPAFEYVAGMDEEPACLIYVTDLCGTFPEDAPDYPVLWAATGVGVQGWAQSRVPWGDVVDVE